MNKKIVFIIIIAISCIICGYYFEYLRIEKQERYSLEELKELLKQTNSMVECFYNHEKPYDVCSGDNVIRTISDKNAIDKIVSIIYELEPSHGVTTMEGAGAVLHAFDKDGNFLLNVFYAPYIAIEKGVSGYNLGRKECSKLIEIVDNVE